MTKSSLGRRIRIAFGALVIVALSLPVAFFATFLLLPLWRWIEASFGLEIVGHSGPAEWCFLLVFALTAGLLLWFYFRFLPPPPAPQ
jgi:hypothetical protein